MFILGGTVVATAGVLNAIREGIAISGATPPKPVDAAVDTKSLLTTPNRDALPSVTEGTTQLIGVGEGKTNKMMDT